MQVCSVDGCGREVHTKGLCRKCYNAAHYAANAEKMRARARKYREENPEKVRETQQKYEAKEHRRQAQAEKNKRIRLADPEKRREACRKWHADNREDSRRRASEWQRNNPDKVAAIQHRRRARKRQAEGTWTEFDWLQILYAYGTICPCCGRDGLPLTVDHVVPLALGGTNWPDNLQPLCAECNQRKGDRHSTRYAPRHAPQDPCHSRNDGNTSEP